MEASRRHSQAGHQNTGSKLGLCQEALSHDFDNHFNPDILMYIEILTILGRIIREGGKASIEKLNEAFSELNEAEVPNDVASAGKAFETSIESGWVEFVESEESYRVTDAGRARMDQIMKIIDPVRRRKRGANGAYKEMSGKRYKKVVRDMLEQKSYWIKGGDSPRITNGEIEFMKEEGFPVIALALGGDKKWAGMQKGSKAFRRFVGTALRREFITKEELESFQVREEYPEHEAS